MQISGILSDIFLKIANKLGFQLQAKQINYDSDFYDVSDISMTAVLSDRLSTMIIADSDVEVTGSRSQVLAEFMEEYFKTKLKPTVFTSLGTGDCLVVPVTNGKVFDVDIITNENFAIISSIGQKIYSCVMQRDTFTRNNKTYRRFEFHGLEEVDGVSICRIYRYGYIDEKEVPLHSVKDWENIPEETIIPNVNQLLFGRFKCPTVNRENINSAQGVPITYGLSVAVEKAKESYDRFNTEYKRKETKIFASKQLFKKDNDNNVVLPAGEVYQVLKTDLEGNLPIKEFAPDLRYNDLRGGVEFNMKMLEMFCGLSNGVLTDVQGVDLATATAIRMSMHSTMAFINTFRKIIESGCDQLIYAVEMLYNANSQNGTIGAYVVKYSWDDSLFENSQETYNQLLQSVSINAVDKAELRAWQMNEPIEVARERITEIEAESEQEPIVI